MMQATASYDIAQLQRATYAKGIFDLVKVSEAINQRAADGFYHLRLYQDLPFNLEKTDAAKSLQDWLRKNGYEYRWLPTYEASDLFRPSPVIEFNELIVSWS